MSYYTGIGSRQTPDAFLQVFQEIARLLACKEYVLRSGGADGADTAFEEGCKIAGGPMEIFLPWSGFNGRSEKNPGYLCSRESHYDSYKRAKEIAAQHHPAWDNLKDSVKMLHTRNVHQVLGLDVMTPSKFVLFYSLVNLTSGEVVGGTGQALRIAKVQGIPCYNFADERQAAEGIKMLKAL